MIEQRSQEWFKLRLGKVTASRINHVITDKKNSISRAKYLRQLVDERLSQRVQHEKSTHDQYLGRIREVEAKKLYVIEGGLVTECSFINHPLIEMSGASPDGLVGIKGQIEIKCPNKANHEKIINMKVVPKKYITQIQFQLAVTQRDWCDFVSYNPESIEKLFVIRVERDERYIFEIESKVKAFLEETELTYQRIKKENAEELYRYL